MIAVFPGFLLKYVGFRLIAERIYNKLIISSIDNLQSLRWGGADSADAKIVIFFYITKS